MRQSQKSNRTRNKNGRKSSAPNVNRVYESSGPEGKVRGTPQQIIEKYLSLARDRATAGDRVLSESFLQHAEHYARILSAAQAAQQQRREERDERDDEPDFDGDENEIESQPQRGGYSEGMAVIGDDDGGPEIVPTPESMSEPRRQSRRRDGEEGGDGPRRKPRRPPRKPKNPEDRRSDGAVTDGEAPVDAAPREPVEVNEPEWTDEPAAEAARAAG